ncbi:MAG TPA: peptidase S1, partial [Candidatus Binataceae bacterium]|nr:peptidase S1 [Candidatus Binataceae bacterium]
MHFLSKGRFLVSAVLLLAPAASLAQGNPPAPKAVAQESTTQSAPPDSTTAGEVDAGGQHIAYSAIAGTITVGSTDAEDAQLGPDGKPLPGTQLAATEPKDPAQAQPVARMFYVAYFKKDANPDERPVTFLYNGGPGSSTVWLHMGAVGPKHVVTAGDQHLPGPPYKLTDNPNPLLDVSDLVFIDAPGTGFGRLIGKDADKAFWGVDQDGGAFTRFIARFL